MSFPDWYTIDDLGLEALNYFLKKEYKGKTILIKIEEIENEKDK